MSHSLLVANKYYVHEDCTGSSTKMVWCSTRVYTTTWLEQQMVGCAMQKTHATETRTSSALCTNSRQHREDWVVANA